MRELKSLFFAIFRVWAALADVEGWIVQMTRAWCSEKVRGEGAVGLIDSVRYLQTTCHDRCSSLPLRRTRMPASTKRATASSLHTASLSNSLYKSGKLQCQDISLNTLPRLSTYFFFGEKCVQTNVLVQYSSSAGLWFVMDCQKHLRRRYAFLAFSVDREY